MDVFQQGALALIGLWLAAICLRFRNSTTVLTGGLVTIGVVALACVALKIETIDRLGLSAPTSWIATLEWAFAGLAVMLAYSPVADAIATRLFAKPPTLGVFHALQQSPWKLLVGILIAWILGAFLEELAFRGIVLNALTASLAPKLGPPAGAGIAIVVAALGAGVVHLYQGARAAVIITQLSAMFGILFVLSGYDLWATIVCHGLYDTIAFIRFAAGKSKYSKPAASTADPSL